MLFVDDIVSADETGRGVSALESIRFRISSTWNAGLGAVKSAGVDKRTLQNQELP